MDEVFYFAFGSNMSYQRISERVGACRVAGVGILNGYSLRFHKRGRDGSGKCDAFKTAHVADRVYGVVFAMTMSQIEILDDFEGPDYERELVALHNQDRQESTGGEIAGFAYLAKPHAIDANLVPYDWYKGFVYYGAVENALPDDYARAIGNYPHSVDPDPSRRLRNLAILGRTELEF
jgi:hypothetical protein